MKSFYAHLQTINNKNCPKVIQDDLIKNKLQLKIAPKINKDDCEVDWNKSTHEIYNFIRGLSPFPTAWTQITSDYEKLYLKIYKVKIIEKKHNYQIGKIITDNKKYFRVAVSDGLIDIIELQLQGKKRLNIKEFLLGFQKLKDFSVLPK